VEAEWRLIATTHNLMKLYRTGIALSADRSDLGGSDGQAG
jgi:hypothetical protein